MMGPIIILLISLGGAVSQNYAPYQQPSTRYPQPSDYQTQSSGGQYSMSYGGDILPEVRKLARNVTALHASDDNLGDRLVRLIDETEVNFLLTDTFLAQQFPDVQASQAENTQEINYLESQVNELLWETDDLIEIAALISEADYQLKEIAEQSKEIQKIAAELQKGDANIGKKLSTISYQLAAQEATISRIEREAADASERLPYLHALIEKSHKIVLDERESGSFSVTLRHDNPMVSQVVPYNGKRTPMVQYGITALHLVNDKESIIVSYPDYSSDYSYGKTPASIPAQIFYDLDVFYEPKGKTLTTSFLDHSTGGWFIEKMVVSIILINIDDTIIEIKENRLPTNIKY